LNGGDPTTAIDLLKAQSRQLRRRDIASWLTLELEIVRLEERYLEASVGWEHKKNVLDNATAYGAAFVADALRSEVAEN